MWPDKNVNSFVHETLLHIHMPAVRSLFRETQHSFVPMQVFYGGHIASTNQFR